ncbi:hypothetical protein QBC38DRAFT_446412 [Podospora fimiseda]|uniref:Glycoside Hydrolase Family 61 n=1 Tax=Podospora fimiseda TaxID=252190 RepID=A0AAN7BJE7_9PEZI|nr:hypothetical protein QBC38DRAFT_446412 [Podospora fimiseda]
MAPLTFIITGLIAAASALPSSVTDKACLDHTSLQSASFYTGLEPNTPGIRPGLSNSSTSPNNFINFCSSHILTNGQQNPSGSCNPIPLGRIPSTENMVSSLITYPSSQFSVPEHKTFNVTILTRGLSAGYLVNPSVSYYTAPQDLDASTGEIKGHCHVTIQSLGDETHVLDARDYVFFKGVDDAGIEKGNGVKELWAEVKGGLPKGRYRVCSMASASNHQPVVMPVASRGAQDDCVRFVVGEKA